jgi:hypothetical protein
LRLISASEVTLNLNARAVVSAQRFFIFNQQADRR